MARDRAPNLGYIDSVPESQDLLCQAGVHQHRAMVQHLRIAIAVSLILSGALAHSQYAVSYTGGRSKMQTSPWIPYSLLNGFYGGGGSGNSVVCTDPVQVVFTWQGAGEPPLAAYLVIESSATANYTGPAGPVGQWTLATDNGIDSDPVESTSSLGPVISVGRATSGLRAVYVQDPGRTYTVSLSPSASTTSNAGGNASVKLRASLVQKVAAIDRLTAPAGGATFRKGADGLPEPDFGFWTVTPRVSNVAFEARPAEVWVPNPWGGGSWVPCFMHRENFRAQLVGAWIQPFRTWITDLFTASDPIWGPLNQIDPDWHLTAEQFAALSENPITKLVKLNVEEKGPGGGVFPAEYKLILHHPYERWRPGPAKDPFWTQAAVTLDVASPGYARFNGGIECTWTDWPWWIEPTQTSLLLATKVTTALFENPIWAAFFTAVGVSLEELVPHPNGGTAMFDDCSNDPHSTFPAGGRPPASEMPLYRMTPVPWDYVKPVLATCDHYGSSGYVGVFTRADAMKVVGEKFAGSFSYIGERG